MASLANSPTKAFVNKVNCILVMSTVGKTLKLVSKTKIYAGSEIIWCYTNSYRYPPQYNQIYVNYVNLNTYLKI